MKKLAILLLFTLTATSATADVNQAVDNFFSSMNADVNVATVVQNQSAGVASGGGFSTRSQVVNLTPARFTPPSFNTSCGNLNFYAGSFSFLTNTDQLIAFLQNTLMTAGVTAVMVALKAATPNIAGTLQSMFDEANKLMNMFNNSCQLGTALGNIGGNAFGDAVQKTTGHSLSEAGDASAAFINNSVIGSAGRTINDSMRSVRETYEGWVGANATANPDSADPLKQKNANDYGSVIWKGLQKEKLYNLPGINGSQGLSGIANLVISLTGDVIIYSPTDDGTEYMSTSFDPAIPDAVDFLTESANLEVYNCTYFSTANPGECTPIPSGKHLEDVDYPLVEYKGGVVTKIDKAITDIQTHFTSNTPLTSDDLMIIAISPVPIFAIAQTLDDMGMAGSINYFLTQYKKEISFSILQKLVDISLQIAMKAAINRSNEETAPIINELIANISSKQAIINSQAQTYMKHDPVKILQDLNFLKGYAQNMMSPDIMQKVNFAKQMSSY